MKTSTTSLFTLSIAAMLFLFVSCGKDGSVGPQGPAGEQGEQGPIGLPGENGAVILSGTGAPAASLGNEGDMYLDKSNSNLYGPKSSNGWGTSLNLKGAKGDKGATGAKGDKGDTGATGAKGATGTAGSQILKGIKAPLTSTGNVGDYYLNTTKGDLYGPKTRTLDSWGTPINLKGTANVISSEWIAIDSWGFSSAASCRKVFTVPEPILNAVGYTRLLDMLDAGGVLLGYCRTGTSITDYNTYPLPAEDGALWRAFFQYAHSTPNDVTLAFTRSASSDLPASVRSLTLGIAFRYVLIPAGRQLSGVVGPDGRNISINQLKAMSYQEAGAVLGWKN